MSSSSALCTPGAYPQWLSHILMTYCTIDNINVVPEANTGNSNILLPFSSSSGLFSSLHQVIHPLYFLNAVHYIISQLQQDCSGTPLEKLIKRLKKRMDIARNLIHRTLPHVHAGKVRQFAAPDGSPVDGSQEDTSGIQSQM
jgi:hypothetical protein